MRYSSNATFLVEAKIDGIELAAIYKPRRGERPLWDFRQGTLCRARGRRVRALRRAGLGHRPPHDPPRRPPRHRRGAAFRRPRPRRALLHPAQRTRSALPRVRLVRRARQQHRSEGRPLPARSGERRDRRHRSRPHVPRRLEAAHGHLGLRRRASPRGRRRRRVSPRGRPRVGHPRRAPRRAPRRRRARCGRPPARMLLDRGLPLPDDWHSTPWPLV